MASLNVNDSGTWRSLALWVNDSAVWRQLVLWVNDAGTWRQLIINAIVELGAQKNMGGLGSPGGVTSVALDANGTWSGFGTTGGSFSSTWVLPTSAAGAAYDVKATSISGNPNSSGTMNTFLSLGTTRSWVSTNAGGAGCQFTLAIYAAADHVTPLDSVTVVFS